ncbi:MAG: hypothetical protein JRJ09_07475 [Deltaproteobacteria bacterium]|nr:hypothetical protein [Deltaproteobacteria bacterium]MBW2111403.1 hypothetical protein [Deltaproteobacteria bacterium]HDZ91421.1 hypothetical protein [Deltaproteobacteria bacterium]
MKNFMEPESVGLIGITRKTGGGSFNLMENMIRCGFSGKIFPVNPEREAKGPQRDRLNEYKG